jgi:hypothetical protein
MSLGLFRTNGSGQETLVSIFEKLKCKAKGNAQETLGRIE